MDTTQETTQIAAELNKLPKPTSYNSLYILAQQAFEAGFRSMTINELVVYLSKNLPDDLTRSEFIYEKFAPGSALPDPGREASVFLGAGTYSAPGGGPDLVLTENFNVVGWDGENWVKVLEVPIEVPAPIDKVELTNLSAPQSDAVYKAIKNQGVSNYNNDFATNVGYNINAVTIFNGDFYVSLKSANNDPVSVTASWTKLNLKPDGLVATGDARSVSGGAVKTAVDAVSTQVTTLKGDYFSEIGYAHGTLGTIAPVDTYRNTGFLPIGDVSQIKLRASNSASASALNFYDKDFKFLGRAIPGTDSSSNKEWTVLRADFPLNAFFVIASAQLTATNRYIDFDSVSNASRNIAGVYEDIKEIKGGLVYKPQIKVPDFANLPDGFAKVNGLEVYKTTIPVKNKKLRVSFRFKFNRDVNTGLSSLKMPLLTLKGKNSGGVDLSFVANLRTQKTDRLITNENRYTEAGKTILSTYPVPKFNTGVGWETVNPNTPTDKRIFDFPARNYPEFKPFAGRDTFRIQYRGLLKNNPTKNVDDADVQQHFDLNKEWKITINETGVVISNGTITESFLFATYPTMSAIFNAIRDKTEAGQTLELFEVESFDTGSTNVLNYGPAYPSNALLRVENIPFVSVYPSMQYNLQDATTTRLDAFSFYAQFGLDDSEHVLELVIDQSKGGGLLNIDGQFIRYASGEGQFNGAADVPALDRILDTGNIEIIIGGGDASSEALIKPYDITIETEKFIDLDFSMAGGRIASWYTPFIVGTGGHAMYKGENIGQTPTGYDDGTPPPDSATHVVPAKYKRHRTGYEGDDYVSINALTSATQNYVRFINELKARGYVNITLNQMSDWFNGNGKLPHYKCFYIQLDDYRTYAFADIDMRREFTKTGTRVSFCLELAKYVDETYTPNAGGKTGVQWMTEQADINPHRLELQKRIQQMQLMKWECVSHGENGNTYTAMTSKELQRVVLESARMSDYLGVYSNIMTWAASQYTVNSVKTFEHNGLSMILRSGGEYAAKCNNKFCVSRLYFDQLNWQNLLTKII